MLSNLTCRLASANFVDMVFIQVHKDNLVRYLDNENVFTSVLQKVKELR